MSSCTQPVGDVAWTCSRPNILTSTPTDIIGSKYVRRRPRVRSSYPFQIPRALAHSVRTSPRACALSSSRALGKPVIATATPTLPNSRPPVLPPSAFPPLTRHHKHALQLRESTKRKDRKTGWARCAPCLFSFFDNVVLWQGSFPFLRGHRPHITSPTRAFRVSCVSMCKFASE